MGSGTGIRISATVPPSARQQRALLILAHIDAPGWPGLLPTRHRSRNLRQLLSPLPQTATCCLTAWRGTDPVGLLLAERPPARKAGVVSIIRGCLGSSRQPASLQRLLRTPAYDRPDGHDGYVSALVVHPHWRRRRIGLRLLQALQELDPGLAWAAHVDHADSHALFLQAGFEEVAETRAEGLVIRTLLGSCRERRRQDATREKTGDPRSGASGLCSPDPANGSGCLPPDAASAAGS